MLTVKQVISWTQHIQDYYICLDNQPLTQTHIDRIIDTMDTLDGYHECVQWFQDNILSKYHFLGTAKERLIPYRKKMIEYIATDQCCCFNPGL